MKARRNPTAVVLEDEAIIALDVSERLSTMGFQVVGSVSSPDEAIDLVEAHRPDLVVADLHADPGRSGARLRAAVRRLRLHLLCVSADCDRCGPGPGRASPCLQKPFTDDGFRDAVATALGDPDQ